VGSHNITYFAYAKSDEQLCLQDVVAFKSLPLPGYEISCVGHTSQSLTNAPLSSSPSGTCDEETAIFKVSHPKQARDVHYFLADNVAQMKQCVLYFFTSALFYFS